MGTTTKLARQQPGQAHQISELACQALMHSDSTLQVRAAKLINRHGDTTRDDLRQTVVSYGDTLYHSTKDLLSDFRLNEAVEEHPAPWRSTTIPQAITDVKNRVQPVETIDDLVFLASQAFDNNDPLHFDMLPAALVNLQSEIDGETVDKLLPAFQRAYRLLMGDWRSTQGVLDHMLANFFVDYGQYLIERFPTTSAELQKLHKAFVRQDQEERTQWSWIGRRIEPLDQWHTHHHDPIYRPFKQLLTEALAAIHQGHGLPLLSTPTHAPYWIDPVALIIRLRQYQQQGTMPGEADWQLAVSRTLLVDTAVAIRLAHEALQGEYRALMCFLLEKDSLPSGTITRPGVWMAAALTKEPATARQQYDQWNWPTLSEGYTHESLSWQIAVTDHHYDRYDYTSRRHQSVPYQQKTLRLDSAGSQTTNRLQRIVRRLLTPLAGSELVIHQNIDLKNPYLSAERNDVARYFSLVPNHPEPLLVLIIRRSVATTHGEDAPGMLIATLQTLLASQGVFGPAAHLLIATSMLSSHKTVRVLAAECWIKGVDQSTIDSERMGRIVGKQESVEFAPLKRFTDLLTGQLLRVSPQHDRALAQLLTACLTELPEKPIRGLRKLLEIYREVVHHCESNPSNAEVQAKLDFWQSVASLRNVASALTTEGLAYAS